MNDIQLIKDAKVDKPISTIIREIDHKDENLDKNLEESEQQAKDKNDQ